MEVKLPGEDKISYLFLKKHNLKEYSNGEFCKSFNCNNKNCKNGCIKTAYDFHDYLIKNGYKIIKKEENNECLEGGLDRFYTTDSLKLFKKELSKFENGKINGKQMEKINSLLVVKDEFLK